MPNNKKIYCIGAMIGTALLSFMPIAHATTYDFTFTENDNLVSPIYVITGTLTTSGPDQGGGYFDVTSLSGTIQSPAGNFTIAGLAPGNATPGNALADSDGSLYTYDNLFSTVAPNFTQTGGILFHSVEGTPAAGNSGGIGNEYLFYWGGSYMASLPILYLSSSDQGNCIGPNCNPGVTGDLVFQARSSDTGETPVPAALPLFASGAALIGALGWRRKRKAAAVASA